MARPSVPRKSLVPHGRGYRRIARGQIHPDVAIDLISWLKRWSSETGRSSSDIVEELLYRAVRERYPNAKLMPVLLGPEEP